MQEMRREEDRVGTKEGNGNGIDNKEDARNAEEGMGGPCERRSQRHGTLGGGNVRQDGMTAVSPYINHTYKFNKYEGRSCHGLVYVAAIFQLLAHVSFRSLLSDVSCD